MYYVISPCRGFMCSIKLMMAIFLPNLTLTKYFGGFASNNALAITLLMLLVSAAIYFIIGTAIGWAVGRLKKKKKKVA